MDGHLFLAAFVLAYPLALMGTLGAESFLRAIDIRWHISDYME